MLYTLVKAAHVVSVALSITLFLLRGLWVFTDSPRRRTAVARVLPHVVDTVLLASAVGLSLMLQQYPLQQPWLTAKAAGLLVYIGLGVVALKRARLWAFVLAVLTFAYIVAVALTHDPLPFG